MTRWTRSRPGSTSRKVNWVLDADIRDFFGSSIRLAGEVPRASNRGPRVLRLIQKWLRAGVIEDGEWSETEAGTAQGASVSPLLANVYLHYVFDLWAHQWRRRHAPGDVILVRYADDYVAGFEHRDDAERFLADLRGRFAKFGLELAAEKTRLIEFGRFAAQRSGTPRRTRSRRRSSSWGSRISARRSRAGRFKLKRVTSKKKMRAKLQSVKTEMRRRMHHPIPKQGAWLARVLTRALPLLRGPGQQPRPSPVQTGDQRLWLRTLRRRSQRHRLTWQRMARLSARWLPNPRILHPWPRRPLPRQNPREEPSALDAHAGICAGGRQQWRSLPVRPA